jgi:SAM-dependent methyltransferase
MSDSDSDAATGDDAEAQTVDDLDADGQRRLVRERYADIAENSGDCCGDESDGTDVARLGYEDEDVSAAADAAAMSQGCGNPSAIAALSTGERVLDLGSGGGFDCFLSAREVGPDGRVIGIDMTPEMIEQARETARDSEFDTVEFRLGEIEHLPVADDSIDVAISNCVVNLSPDKRQVFEEVRRVLVPGGRVAISDVVKTAPMPETVLADPDSVSACVAGAARIDRLETLLDEAGFVGIEIEPREASESFVREWDPERDPSEFVTAATIEARVPTADAG